MFKRLMQAQRAHYARHKARLTDPDRLAEIRARRHAPPTAAAAAWGALTRAAQAEQRGVPAYLDHGTLIYRGQRESVAGVTATVTFAGAVRARPTVTRFVAFSLMPGVPGLTALVAQKRVDERELFLIIDGPDWQWAIKADPRRSTQVRQFAAEVNSAARQAERRADAPHPGEPAREFTAAELADIAAAGQAAGSGYEAGQARLRRARELQQGG